MVIVDDVKGRCGSCGESAVIQIQIIESMTYEIRTTNLCLECSVTLWDLLDDKIVEIKHEL